jgi:broad specificity phosphatase PhoE
MDNTKLNPGDSFPLLSSVVPPLPESSRRIYVLRHGETEWNAKGKIQGGGFDIPLNENGRTQAMAVKKAMEDIPLTLVASSTLSRARETADILREGHPACQRILDAGFKEMSFGEFEGLAAHSLELDPKVKSRFKRIGEEIKHDIEAKFPGGGESTAEVEKRSTKALDKILQDFPEEKHIAVVSHGRTNKVLLASVVLNDVQKFPTIRQSNTCINVFDIDEDGNVGIQILNYIDHVKDNVIIR